MRFAARVPQMGPNISGPGVVRFAQEAERMGYEILAVGDHIVFPERIEAAYPYGGGGPNPSVAAGNYIEPMTLLSYIAGATKSIKLLTGVLVIPYRHPVLAAKMFSCLDFLTQGRVIVGIGVGWLKEEFDVMGMRFEQRGAVTDEILDIYRKLWTEERPRHDGRFFKFDEVQFTPKPVQKPHPPIWVAGNTTVAMRRAVRVGQGWFPIHFTSGEFKPKLQQLRALAEAAGRDPAGIEICLGTSLEFADASFTPELQRKLLGEGNRQKMIDELNAFAAMGVDTVQFDFRTREVDVRLELMERFMSEVRPHVR